MDAIASALKEARYNEVVLVHVNSEEESSETSDLLLTACIDEAGGVTFNNIGCEDAISRHLRAKRWVFPMLNDRRRNRLYEDAIRRASEKISAEGSIHSLDIGSGTGLLAMMSARSLSEPVQVTSLEMSSAMAQLARETILENKLENSVSILEAHSCEMPPLSPRASLCTSELLESGLFGEGWIPAMRDAWERHLLPGAVVVPQRARVYAQLVEGVPDRFGPRAPWLSGFPEGRRLRLSTSSDDDAHVLLGFRPGGVNNICLEDGIQIPLHAGAILSGKDGYPFRVLSDPIEALHVDVSSKEAVPGPQGQQTCNKFRSTSTGVAHGVIFWWQLDLFGSDLTYSTKPGEKEWQDHWHQCLYLFSSGKWLHLTKDSTYRLIAKHDDSRAYFAVSEENPDEDGEQEENATIDRPEKRRHLSEGEMFKIISPLRACQLNDKTRLAALQQGIKSALNQVKAPVVLDLSDFSLCAIMSALLGAKCVSSLEASSGELPLAAARVSQIGNGLPLPSTKEPNVFQILQCHVEQLSVGMLESDGEPVNLVVAEPYYEVLEGWHLQEAFNYFYILRALRNRGVVSNKAICVPQSASIKAVAIQSEQLYSAYKPCDSPLCGFQHDTANKYRTNDSLSLPMWQYQYSEMSQPMELARIDYGHGEIVNNGVASKTHFISAGTCHAIMVYLEYDLGPTSLSTNNRCHNQTIRMLKRPENIVEADAKDARASLCVGITIGTVVPGEDHRFTVSVERSIQ